MSVEIYYHPQLHFMALMNSYGVEVNVKQLR